MRRLLQKLVLATGLSLAANIGAHGFSLYQADRLDVTLGPSCINALVANIDCIDYTRQFMQLQYRTSLENVTLTDQVCTGNCGSSLRSWFDAVTTQCAGKSLRGTIPNKFGGYIYAGWNETCVKDPRTKQYCNDIIFNFASVPDITQMPRAELCHVCHTRRLAMMQASQYSVYDDFYKSTLEYVYAQCGGSGPTDVLPPLPTTTPAEPAPYCVTGKRYTTVSGDTCESIANSTGVSSAALYMGNQVLLPDCRAVPPGVSICIPIPCKTYLLQPSDTCLSVELAFGLDFGQIRNYNSPWIDATCSNLQSSTDFYGKLICVSPQGGEFTGTVPSGPAPTPVPGSDGYTRDAVPPPVDIEVAEGTTRSCGKWHVVKAEDTCSTICIQAGIPADLFKQVNPSVATGNCSLALRPQTAVCIGPTYSWNDTAPASTTIISAPLLADVGGQVV